MNQSIVLGIGTGRCGLRSLAKILNQQPETQSSYEEPPLLPWKRCRCGAGRPGAIRSISPEWPWPSLVRCGFLLSSLPGSRHCGRAGDSHHLLEAAAGRGRRQLLRMAGSELSLADQSLGRPARPRLAPRSPSYPDISSIRDAEPGRRASAAIGTSIASGWKNCGGVIREQIRLFDTYEALNTPAGLQDLLAFAGIAPERQVARRGNARQRSARASQAKVGAAERGQSRWTPSGARSSFPSGRRSYRLASGPWRNWNGGATTFAGSAGMRPSIRAATRWPRMPCSTVMKRRCGLTPTWIFTPIPSIACGLTDCRSSCGIYPQKGKRALASHIMPGMPKVVFGKEGGLIEILYAGAGFLHVRREVYLAIQKRQQLPMCNERFRAPMIPFFHSMVHPAKTAIGTWPRTTPSASGHGPAGSRSWPTPRSGYGTSAITLSAGRMRGGIWSVSTRSS